MQDSTALCKVIVHDSDSACEGRIKQFCDANNLVAVKPNSSNILDVLKSNVDLGAIFLSDDLMDPKSPDQPLYRTLHLLRPELPIMLRECTLDGRGEDPSVCIGYRVDHIDQLRSAIDEHIFNKNYPNALIRGIKEITNECLMHVFPVVELETSFPYLIKDRIIYGELFSLIPLESSWCRGYMMLQTDQKHIADLVKSDIIHGDSQQNFRVINDVLSEVTNMVWGKIRNRFMADNAPVALATQVPIIVNHQNKYITFGTEAPQLCFKYTLKQSSSENKTVTLYQKFVFNLNWAPEKFSENQPTVDDFIQSGELEFF